MSLQDKASIVLPKGFAGKAGTLECWNPNTDSLVGLSVVRATTATRVNESGLIESVAANVPRRDFTNGGCGDLLVEPQGTNLFKNYDPSTGDTTTSVGVTYAANDWGILGFSNKTIYPETASTQIVYDATISASTQYTLSAYIKFPNGESISPSVFGTGSGKYGYFNLGGKSINTGYVVKEVAENIYRVSVTKTSLSLPPNVNFTGFIRISSNDDALMEVTGFQVEQGAYVTSIIPTAGAAVTRNADFISGTGLAALLGQSAGGVYVEAAPLTSNLGGSINLNTGVLGNEVRIFFDDISTNIRMQNLLSGSANVNSNIGTYLPNTFAKIAFRYADDNFAGCVNGGAITADTSATIATGLSDIDFSRPGGSSRFYGRIRELVIFKEAPDNAQLAAITTP